MRSINKYQNILVDAYRTYWKFRFCFEILYHNKMDLWQFRYSIFSICWFILYSIVFFWCVCVLICKSFFLCFLFAWRYHQSSNDDETKKTTNDYTTVGQQAHSSVPLCITSDVQLRFLCPDDLEEVRTLCQDWFPIDYPFSWYEDITSSTRFFALAAVYNLTIIGLIVAEIKPYARLNKEVPYTQMDKIMIKLLQFLRHFYFWTPIFLRIGSWYSSGIDGQRMRCCLYIIVRCT